MGLLGVQFENGRNILHLCVEHSAKSCLSYLINFHIIDPNTKDDNGHTPLYSYLILNKLSESNFNNQQIFLSLIAKTNCKNTDNITLMNEWQKNLYDKYSNSYI